MTGTNGKAGNHSHHSLQINLNVTFGAVVESCRVPTTAPPFANEGVVTEKEKRFNFANTRGKVVSKIQQEAEVRQGATTMTYSFLAPPPPPLPPLFLLSNLTTRETSFDTSLLCFPRFFLKVATSSCNIFC